MHGFHCHAASAYNATQSTPGRPQPMNEPTLEELLANVLRDTGWIMAGGSAQFRHAALSELQASLRQIHRHPLTARVEASAKLLGERATQVAAKNVNNAETLLALHRILAEFE